MTKPVFVRLTQQPEGLPILVRANRIAAVARTEEGGSRVFLGGALSVLVGESEDEVLAALSDLTADVPHDR